MSGLHAGPILAYMTGASVFVCAVMALYWGMQKRVPPGYGLWTASFVLAGTAAGLLADQGHFPAFIRVLCVPGLLLLAYVIRSEGLRRFLGGAGFGHLWLSVPVLGVGLLAVFAYAWDEPPAQRMVTAALVALVLLRMAKMAWRSQGRLSRWLSRAVAGCSVIYGLVWLVSGVYWLVASVEEPFSTGDPAGVAVLVAAATLEALCLLGCLVASSKWNSDYLELSRGEAEDARRQLADLVALLPDATLALDTERRVIAWNKAAEATTGVPAEAMVGLRWEDSGMRDSGESRWDTLSELLTDPSRPVPSRYRNVQREEGSVSAEEQWHDGGHPDKPLRLWRTAALLKDASGEVTGTIECVRDVSWMEQTERAMRESEERYRSLFEHSLDGILVIAPGGAVIDANASACRLLGMTKEQVCAADSGGLISWAGRSVSGPEQDSALGTAVRELTFVRGDGSRFPAECMSVAWNDSKGHLRAFVQFRDITERIEAQRILRESQAKLFETQTVSRVGSWEMDLVGQSIWMSAEALRIFGLSRQTAYFPLETASLTSLAEDPAALQTVLTRVMTGGGSYDMEYLINRADDGVQRKVHSVGAAVCNDDGVPVKVVGVTRDMTDAGTSQGPPDLDIYSLGHSEDQVFWVDAQGRLVNVNQSACLQLGYSRDELLAMTIHDLNPELPLGSAEPLDSLRAVGSRRYEGLHRKKDGKNMPVELTVNYASHGGQDYKFVVAHDISERKRLEEVLARTRLSLERGGEVIVWADAEGRLVFATDAACLKLGYSREELLSLTVFDVDLSAARDWSSTWAELTDSGVVARETSCSSKDGSETPMEAVFHRVEHDGRDYALIVAHDLGVTRGEERPGAHGGVDAGQHQKLEAVGQLAGGIAHDFNNLLTAIIGYGNLILADEGAQGLKSLRRDAEEIRNAAERAAALTSQILAFARQQPLRPRKLRLSELVVAEEEHLRSLVADNILLVFEPTSDGGVVEVDTEQFKRVLENLVSNAGEAMPQGGCLVVGVEDVDLNEEHCRVYPELRPGLWTVLSVSDNGVGMDADTRLRMFDPFFTTKPPGEGSGLGLSVVYGIVRQSGGHVVVQSEVGAGTTLKIYLPSLADTPDLAAPDRTQAAALSEGGETVLLVEDEPPLRRLVARVLGEGGYRVFVAGTGPEALELLEDMDAPPDLLITDVVLPGGLQGSEVALQFTSRIPGLAVLYVSGHPRDTIVNAGRLNEGVSFLAKPFTPQGLAAKVREVLDSRE